MLSCLAFCWIDSVSEREKETKIKTQKMMMRVLSSDNPALKLLFLSDVKTNSNKSNRNKRHKNKIDFSDEKM